MSASPRSQATTRRFARVIGPFLVVICAAAAARWQDLQTSVSELSANALWGWVAGAFTLLAGLIVVALHPYWREPAAVIVSVTGWLTTLKGLFLVAFPATYTASIGDAVIGSRSWLVVVYVIFALLGLYLSCVGWAPAPKRSAPEATSAHQLRHAA